ncbi:MAG: hypothetical protein IKE62_01235 [Oscillospiraceae bacterium]|nr:hypothetical protein [Oscillospiraceae bacterium]
MPGTTDKLNTILKNTKPERIADYLNDNTDDFLPERKPFAEYFRSRVREKGLKQQEVFLNADISEGYGYKLISEEKHTRQRDTLLRLCLGAHLDLDEAQRALKIYGMAPFYSRLPRDSVLMVAFSSGTFEISEVNTLLIKNKMPPLKGTEE